MPTETGGGGQGGIVGPLYNLLILASAGAGWSARVLVLVCLWVVWVGERRTGRQQREGTMMRSASLRPPTCVFVANGCM